MIKRRKWLIINPLLNDSASYNKDLNGGYGTWNKIVEEIISQIIAKSKEKNIIPVRFII